MMQSAPYAVSQQDARTIGATLFGWRKSDLILIPAAIVIADAALAGGYGATLRWIMLVVFVAVSASILVRLYLRGLVRRWAEQHAECASFVAWDSLGISTGGCVHGSEWSAPWESFGRIDETREFFVFRPGGGFLPLRKSTLDDQAMADFRRQIEAHNIQVRELRS